MPSLSALLTLDTLALILINMVLAWSMWLPLSAGQFCFSTAGSAAVGAFVAARAGQTLGVPLVGQLLLALGAGLAFGVLPGIMAIRLRGFSFALASLALAEAVDVSIASVPGLGGASGLVAIFTSGWLIPLAAVVVVLLVGLSYLVGRSHSGRVVDVLAQDQTLAEGLGVASSATKMTVLMLSSGVAAVGGALLGNYTGYLSAEQFDLSLTTQLFAFVVVGGVATFVGPLFGAAVLTAVLQLVTTIGTLQNIIFGALLVVVILVRRDGLLTRSHALQVRRLRGILAARTGRSARWEPGTGVEP